MNLMVALFTFLAASFLPFGRQQVFAQYPTPTPMGTCYGLTGCVVMSGACGDVAHGCLPTESYSYTQCGSTICNEGCHADTSCLPSNPCAAMVGCYWVPDASCGGGTCGCGESRTAVQYCPGPNGDVHCNDQCSGIASCCVGCTGSCNNTTDPTLLPS